ncbi:MAG TPA: DinB family protein [Chryseolinea sp.]|nr:DinB family protein [Chryseolinea sp.]
MPVTSNAPDPNISEIPAILRQLTADYATRLQQIDDDTFGAKPRPEKWSKKEILGHLIDSAENNLRRFITTQYEAEPPHIVYDQDFWVTANDYNQVAAHELVSLWKLLNNRIAAVLENLPASKSEKLCNTGKGVDEFHTLRFLAVDYLAHAEHHLKQLMM